MIGFIEKTINWYFNKTAMPLWLLFLLDIFIIFISYMFLYQQQNSGVETLRVFWQLCYTILLYTTLYAIGFRIFRTYSGILRYSSFIDLQRVAFATLFGALATICVSHVIKGNHNFVDINTNIILYASLLSIFIIWSIRIIVKILYDISLKSINAKYTLIYGIKEGGIGIAKHIRNEKPTRFILKGFLTTDQKMSHRLLMGVKVYNVSDNINKILADKGIEAVIVSPLCINAFRTDEHLQNQFINAGIHIYIPKEQEWSKNSNLPQLKEISIEDLLPRDEIQIDTKQVEQQITGKRILITGSAGSIGSELIKQISAYKPRQLILIDQAETPQHDIRLVMAKQWGDVDAEIIVTSICKEKKMEKIFKTYKPDYVFHAAAYKHVPMMEDNPCEAVQNNVEGTKVIADLSVKYGVKKFVMISTDKAVNPTNVMGCSKRICEIYVQSLDKAIKDGKIEGTTEFVTTRFGNVLGSNGSVIPLFREQIKHGGPLTVTHPDIFRYFMLIPEACKLVLEAGTMGNGGEIFVFDMGAPVKIVSLAQRMIKLSGANNIEIKFTGLRDGEKLYEEVLNDQEITKSTSNDKIKIATVREYDFNEINMQIGKLIKCSYEYDDMKAVAEMKKIVPEYKSNHSKYEVLD